ncbi:MAG: fluoride efflux transporter CrcB [Campylobacterota bacterium]|nr:fluoride efflux transporter CrcB [Campylobacterota bacterium]
MVFNLPTVIAVGIGGFLGAISRFYAGVQVLKYFPHQLPMATLGVNLLGSFIVGILVGVFLHFTPSNELKGFLVIGFLGAFTTYSTFAIESYMLLNTSFWYGILNIVLNVIGTIVAAGLGYKLISYFIK